MTDAHGVGEGALQLEIVATRTRAIEDPGRV